MTDKLLSVIIPVYNVEKYLPECLDSVINQTYPNLEIICVYDESADRSFEILQEYAQKDTRIKIIDKKNNGLGAARNTGLQYVTGELVAFLDSDDWLALDFYSRLIERLNADASDIAIGETFYVYPTYTRKNAWVNYYNFRQDKNIVEEIEDKADLIYACACWNKVYKTRLIKEYSLTFPEGLYIEDVPFTFASTIYAKRISKVKDAILYYRRRESSLLGSAQESRMSFDIFKIYDVCDAMLEQAKIDDATKIQYEKIADNFKIFNISHWYFLTGEKYQEEFFETLKAKIKLITIKNNRYVTPKEKHLYNIILNSKSHLEFQYKHDYSFMEKIFSLKNSRNKKYKILTILGLRIKFKKTKTTG